MTRQYTQTALVTGAAGFIGSHLVDALLEQNLRVVGLDNLSTGTKSNLEIALEHEAFNLIEGDIRDRETIEHACDKVKVIFHLAAVTKVAESLRNPQKYHDINVKGTQNVINAAVNKQVSRLVFTSSAAVYGTPAKIPIPEEISPNPLSPYGTSKVEGERLCQEAANQQNLQAPQLRCFNVYGPRQTIDNEAGVISIFLHRARQGLPLVIYGDGHQTRDFIYIEDAVEAFIRAATLDAVSTQPINLGTGIAISIRELAEEIQNQVPSCPIEIQYEVPRAGDIYHSVARIDRLRRILDFTPRYALRNGIAKTLEF
ncbi:MAG: SDR family NAD(P)-dependent oxidoreductase [Promethearchaeota archaeon]